MAANNFHELPNPHSSVSGVNTSDAGNQKPSRVAEKWRPAGTPVTEPKVSTLSRFAGRLIDRITGKAYSADELVEQFGGQVDNAAVNAAIAENSAASRKALEQKQPVTHIAIFGDSRASQSSGVGGVIYAHGPLYWIQLATGSRLTPVQNASGGYSFAQGGQSFVDLNNDAGSYPRVAELIAASPQKTVVFMYCGANGMDDPAAEYAAFQSVTQRFLAAGLYPVAFLEPYLGVSQTGELYQANRNTYNANVISYCRANGIPFVDGMELYSIGTAEQSYDYLFQNDGGYIHPNVRGASVIGIAVARAIEASFELPPFPVTYRTVKNGVSANIGWVNGSFGSNGTTHGFLPAETNCTLVDALVKRTDGQPGYWAKLVITDAGEGAATASTGAGVVQFYNSRLPAAGTYRAVCEIEIDSWEETPAASTKTNCRTIALEVAVLGGATPGYARIGTTISSVNYQEHTIGERGSASPLRGTTNKKFALITQPITIASDATSCITSLFIYGNCELRIGNLALIPL